MDLRLLHKAFSNSTGICTDTRKVEEGNFFVALKGENFNGNSFAKAALDAGCKYALIDETPDEPDDRYIQVKNALETLQALATYHRKKLKCPVIGITGSNGKTTTKELLIEVLSSTYSVGATKGNLNNHIGVPLTLLSFPLDLEMAIVEMGANHQGEIAALCEIACPSYGLITNIGKAHLEGFGGPEGVRKGKKELLGHLNEHGGRFFLNLHEPSLSSLQPEIKKPILYGSEKLAPDIRNIKSSPFLQFEWFDGVEWLEQKTHLTGSYNAHNALTAIAVGMYFGVHSENAQEAIAGYLPSNNRSEWKKTANNELILDAYNSNPTSLKAAINNLAKLNLPNSMVIIGDMLELGDYAHEEHQAIVDLLKEHELTGILVGPHFSATTSGAFTTFPDTASALEWLEREQIKERVILMKGSRGLALEQLVSAL